jgi:nucleoside 2-deoxyribosyltransferase
VARRIYLAGFDVFRADSVRHGAYLRDLCARHGLHGLYPSDNAAPPGLAGPALAHWIFQENIRLIGTADAVMANLNPFRGAEPDSGTAFEVGYAAALGKPVWAYVDDASTIVERVATGREADGGAWRHVDGQGYTVEDFGLGLNLMLACSATVVVGDAAACVARIAAAFDSQGAAESPSAGRHAGGVPGGDAGEN